MPMDLKARRLWFTQQLTVIVTWSSFSCARVRIRRCETMRDSLLWNERPKTDMMTRKTPAGSLNRIL